MGISFVSIFILIYHIFFWVFGLAHSLSWDYAPDVPQGEAANVRVSWTEKPICGFVLRNMLKIKNRKNDGQDLESPGSQTRPVAQIELASIRSFRVPDEEVSTVRRTLHSSIHSCQDSPARSHKDHGSRTIPPSPTLTPPRVPSWLKRVLAAIAVLVTPISLTVAISLLIALVDPLKALFVSFEGGPSWKAPDGKPPLAFVIDTGFSISPPPSSKLSDMPLTTKSQTDRCDHRPHDFTPFGCIIRPDGCQAESKIWPSDIRPPISLCREDGPPADRGSVRDPGHDSQWHDKPRVEGSDLRRYLRERHSVCDQVRVWVVSGFLSDQHGIIVNLWSQVPTPEMENRTCYR